MLPYKVILRNTVEDIDLLVAAFSNLQDATQWAQQQVAFAEWSSPRMWHTYRIETDE